MKMAQLIAILLLINIGYVFVNFVALNQTPQVLESELNDVFSSMYSDMSGFHVETTNQQNFLQRMVSDALQGVSNVLNVVIVGIKLVIFVSKLYLKPLVNLASGDGIVILRMMGLLGHTFLWWMNVRLAIHLYAFIKGSET